MADQARNMTAGRRTNKRPIASVACSSPLGRDTARLDVGKRRSLECEAERKRQDLAHIARVAMLGGLTTSLAHELNQPLSAILSNAQAAKHLLDAPQMDTGELRAILDDVAADARRAGEIIRHLRSLLQNGQLKRQPLDLNELIGEAVRLTHSEALLAEITVSPELAPALPLILGDRVQLQQVILNLLLNGFDSLKTITDRARRVRIGTRSLARKTVEVEVADNGTGIAPDKIERAFEPFVTDKPAGMGLGLSICRSIVNAHGGRIWARNNIGYGATFRFVLPVH